MKPADLSLVVAAYNEIDALPKCVEACLAYLRESCPRSELILVDDGSNDGTSALCDELAEKHNEIRAIHLEHNSGMGAALLAGYAVCTRPFVSMLPGDGQIAPDSITALFEQMDDETAVVTTLYKNRRYPLGRKILSVGLRTLTALIVGTRARTEGNYLVRREILEQLHPCSTSFLLNLEIPIRAKRAKLKVNTAHIDVLPRLGGVSKATSSGRILRTFADLFRLRLTLERERFCGR